MSACGLYIKKLKKGCNDCRLEKQNYAAMLRGEEEEIFYDCLNCKKCHSELNLPYRIYKDANTVLNDFGNGKIELVRYKKNFSVLDDYENLRGNVKVVYIDNEELLIPVSENIRDFHLENNLRAVEKVKRNFEKITDEDGRSLLVPTSENVRDWHLYNSIKRCSSRAQNKYYGYALSNEWDYFCTFTVSPDTCDRFDDDTVKSLWTRYWNKLKHWDNTAKSVCVPERHENGALHFHSLLSTTRPLPLKIYKDKNGIEQVSKTGAPLFTADIWNFGICTYAILPKEDNQSAVINYLITYVTKQSNLGYGNKRFYRSHNLNYKNMECDYKSDEACAEIINTKKLLKYKDTDRLTVYRNFNVKEPLEELIEETMEQEEFDLERWYKNELRNECKINDLITMLYSGVKFKTNESFVNFQERTGLYCLDSSLLKAKQLFNDTYNDSSSKSVIELYNELDREESLSDFADRITQGDYFIRKENGKNIGYKQLKMDLEK